MLEFIVHHSQPDGRKSRCEDNGKQKIIPKLFRPTQYGVPSTETHMADNQKVGL